MSLLDLPAELLNFIQLEALSSALPCVCRHLFRLYAAASPTHKAAYLFGRHPHSTLSRAIKYPVCSLPVVHALERITAKPLRCPELPRRLAKGGDAVDLALIEYLLTTYSASPNSKNGYFLARAVVFKHLPLIRLLLEHGADPSLKQGWAVVQAVSDGDLALVKILMEPPSREVDRLSMSNCTREINSDVVGTSKKRRRSATDCDGSAKRRKGERRCAATPQMLEVAVRKGHWQLVDYLSERGAVPSLEVLQLLS